MPQFFQLIKTGSASSDVREQVGELSVRRLLGEFQQDFSSPTGCAEDWESLRARPCQMRRAVFFPNPFFAPQLNTESEPNCHLAPSRIPRSMIAVDENLCVYSPSGEPWDIVCDVSTVRLMLGSSRSCRICRSRHSRLGRVSGFLLSPGPDCACMALFGMSNVALFAGGNLSPGCGRIVRTAG